MTTIQLEVKGMTCDHCVNAVTTALKDTDGVSDAEVSLDENSATVQGDNIDISALLAAIDEEGYEAAVKD
jgi:copper chaperone